MRAFDQLPRDLREALTGLAFNWDASDALQMVQWGYSTDAIVRKLREMEQQKHNRDASTGQIAGGQRL